MRYVKDFSFFGDDIRQVPCLTGKGAPASGLAVEVGILYLDTDEGKLYKCPEVGVWKAEADGSTIAEDSEKLGGKDASEYALKTSLDGKLGKTEKAADSAKLGGADAASYALKTDSAPNAEKLGGKAPEYYLTPVNLLRNGDFLNPVNSRGVKANTTHWEYVLDCWHCESADYTPNTVLISNGGVTLAPTANIYCGIQQQFERYSELAGKVCTAAVCTNDTWYVATFPIGSTSGSGILLGNGLHIYSLSTHHFLIRNTAGNGAVTIQRVALYEGSYTAETLPPYVPAHPRVESLKLGNPVHPVNLLDNSNFTNPVNQRGQTSYSVNSYTIDRWKSFGGSVAIASGKLTTSWQLYQLLEWRDTNKTYTFVVETDADIVIVSGKPSDAVSVTRGNTTIRLTTSGDYVNVVIEPSSSGGVVNVVRAALYEGTYTAETLPPYVPKPYAVELAECQRYAYVIGGGVWLTGFHVGGHGLVVPLEIPAMRLHNAPTVNGAYQAYVSGIGWVDITLNSVGYNWETGRVQNLVFQPPAELPQGSPCIVSGITGIFNDL